MRIACISDIHGNHYALSIAIQHIDRLKVDKTVFLGDAIGYFPSLKPIDILSKKKDLTCLKGNHEIAILEKVIIREKDILYRHQDIVNSISPEQHSIINSWFDSAVVENTVFFHGGPDAFFNQYIYPDSDLEEVYNSIKEIDKELNICVMGHTHHPFVKSHKDILFVNCGSVGLPRDHGLFGSFAVIDTQLKEAEIYRFNLEEAQRDILKDYPDTHKTVIDLFSRNKEDAPLGVIL